MSSILSWDSFLVVSGKNLLKSADAAGVVVVDENDAGLEKKYQIFFLKSYVMSGSCHLDSSSNVEIGIEIWLFIYFFVFCRDKKKQEIAVEFCNLFLYLEGAPNLISQEQVKNTMTKKFKIRRKFRHDMIQTKIDFQESAISLENSSNDNWTLMFSIF